MARRPRQSKTRQEPRTFNGMPTRVWIIKGEEETFHQTEKDAIDSVDEYDIDVGDSQEVGVYDLVEVLSIKKEIRIEKAAVPSTKVPKIFDPNAIYD